jgi:U6 snRNA-associated Sm-like protein LSm6
MVARIVAKNFSSCWTFSSSFGQQKYAIACSVTRQRTISHAALMHESPTPSPSASPPPPPGAPPPPPPAAAAAPPPPPSGSPTEFLKGVVGKKVVVRLTSGVDYRGTPDSVFQKPKSLTHTHIGILSCLDGYMNIAMEQTEEHVGEVVTNRYGDAFIRGNNGESVHPPSPSPSLSRSDLT